MNTAYRSLFGLAPLRTIPVTSTIMGMVLGVSLIGAVVERKLGVGLSTLNYQRHALFDLELWRLATYAFVESTFFGLIFALLILWIFGGWFERSFGRRDTIRFFSISVVGAAILAIPLGILFDIVMPFHDPGIAEGPDAALDAMLVAFALTYPNSNILFGFVLPMRTRTVIYLILGLELIRGIQTGAAGLSITVSGMVIGYLLVTGSWRPARLLMHWQALHRKRRRNDFYIVVPKDQDRLH